MAMDIVYHLIIQTRREVGVVAEFTANTPFPHLDKGASLDSNAYRLISLGQNRLSVEQLPVDRKNHVELIKHSATETENIDESNVSIIRSLNREALY